MRLVRGGELLIFDSLNMDDEFDRDDICKEALSPAILRVSEHAVEQFQCRIAALPDHVVRQIILGGITTARSVKVLPDGATVRVRTRRPFPYEFRAIVIYDRDGQSSVVATVLRGDSQKVRKQRRREQGSGRMIGPGTDPDPISGS